MEPEARGKGAALCGRLGVVLAATVGSMLAACAARTPVPRTGPHTEADKPVEVRTLPPEPTRVEVLPPQPSPEAVWVDGRWEWAGRRWVWLAGTWEVAPRGAYYAPPALVRIPVPVYGPEGGGTQKVLRGYGMTLMFIPGHWHLEDGRIEPIGAESGPGDAKR